MRLKRADFESDKGWYAGPWESDLGISVGFANLGIDDPHVHTLMTEIYLVVRGSAEIRVNTETHTITSGDVLIIDPGEAHTFLSSTGDYHHFVIHTPGLAGEAAKTEKASVSRSELGLSE